MKLYHFTAAFRLPAILEQGITKGDVPLENMSYAESPEAANLTRDMRPEVQNWTGKNGYKKQIRLTVEIDRDELNSFNRIAKKHRMSRQWLKALDPFNQRHDWFFAFDGVSPEQITKVEVLRQGRYVALTGDELDQFIHEVETERKKLNFQTLTSGVLAGAEVFRVKPGRTTWLFANSVG